MKFLVRNFLEPHIISLLLKKIVDLAYHFRRLTKCVYYREISNLTSIYTYFP
jgi:hypothetical protein